MDGIVVNSLLALLTACGAAALLGPLLIPVLHRLKFGQNVRDDGPQTHLKKQDTPTMGGVIILIAIVLATLIFARKNYTLAILALLMAVLFGLIGFFDDFIKIMKKRSMGLRAWQKIAAQFVLALLFSLILYFHAQVGGTVWFDRLDLGVFFIPFAMFVIVATVNSVNLCGVRCVPRFFGAQRLSRQGLYGRSRRIHARRRGLGDGAALAYVAAAAADGHHVRRLVGVGHSAGRLL